MSSWSVNDANANQFGIVPNKTRVLIIYPTVDPQVVVVPIVSSIFVFPIIVFLCICWLRKMAAKRRQRARLAHRDDYWNERSCASIVQRSPPLSVVSIGNGCSSGNRFGTIDIELATTTLDVDMSMPDFSATTTQFSFPNNNNVERRDTTIIISSGQTQIAEDAESISSS